jgi:mannose-6-phosphate isomerase
MDTLAEARFASQRGRLIEWLTESAYPRWATDGFDASSGGFFEALDTRGRALALSRRCRVPPRQIHAFALAPSLGWRGDAGRIVRLGLDHFRAQYRRGDGLYRTRLAHDGTPLDDSALLYDQAFALLGFSSAAIALDARREMEAYALELRHLIEARWKVGTAEFLAGDEARATREANPHMHLLEACLAWAEAGADPGWALWAEELASLAEERLVDASNGALPETFGPAWTAAGDAHTTVIEPGHQYEWAWLLMRSQRRGDDRRLAAARRLISVAEAWGVRSGLAVNALDGHFGVRDGGARLWAQTERLRAAQLAARLTDEPGYVVMASDAAAGIFRYLMTPVGGLYFDEISSDGAFSDAPVMASTFYHLVGAIASVATPSRH